MVSGSKQNEENQQKQEASEAGIPNSETNTIVVLYSMHITNPFLFFLSPV